VPSTDEAAVRRQTINYYLPLRPDEVSVKPCITHRTEGRCSRGGSRWFLAGWWN